MTTVSGGALVLNGERGPRKWARPVVRQIGAGSAEQGGKYQTDIGVNFS